MNKKLHFSTGLSTANGEKKKTIFVKVDSLIRRTCFKITKEQLTHNFQEFGPKMTVIQGLQ